MHQSTCTECGARRQPRRGGRGLCHPCYQRSWKRGEAPRRPRSAASVRFWRRVVWTTDDCWIWTGSKPKSGHGTFYFEGASVKAYRWAYEYLVGPIPAGLHLDHLCMNPPCVNPLHLEPVTGAENARRRWAAQREQVAA